MWFWCHLCIVCSISSSSEKARSGSRSPAMRITWPNQHSCWSINIVSMVNEWKLSNFDGNHINVSCASFGGRMRGIVLEFATSKYTLPSRRLLWSCWWGFGPLTYHIAGGYCSLSGLVNGSVQMLVIGYLVQCICGYRWQKHSISEIDNVVSRH